MTINDEIKKLLDDNQKFEFLKKEEVSRLEMESALNLKMRLIPPAPSQESKKNDEKEIKKILPKCGRCGDGHLGGCMKPPKPK